MAEIPTIKMIGPAGTIVINKSKEQEYRAQGYRAEGEELVKPASKKTSAKKSSHRLAKDEE